MPSFAKGLACEVFFFLKAVETRFLRGIRAMLRGVW
jgi:hypothetical protein